jgi:hypothetical protein
VARGRRELLADLGGAEPADVFVEDTTDKLVRLLGLPNSVGVDLDA